MSENIELIDRLLLPQRTKFPDSSHSAMDVRGGERSGIWAAVSLSTTLIRPSQIGQGQKAKGFSRIGFRGSVLLSYVCFLSLPSYGSRHTRLCKPMFPSLCKHMGKVTARHAVSIPQVNSIGAKAQMWGTSFSRHWKGRSSTGKEHGLDSRRPRQLGVILHSFSRLFLAHEDRVLRRFALALDGDGSYGMVGRLRRQAGESHAIPVLLKLHLLAAGQQPR